MRHNWRAEPLASVVPEGTAYAPLGSGDEQHDRGAGGQDGDLRPGPGKSRDSLQRKPRYEETDDDGCHQRERNGTACGLREQP